MYLSSVCIITNTNSLPDSALYMSIRLYGPTVEYLTLDDCSFSVSTPAQLQSFQERGLPVDYTIIHLPNDPGVSVLIYSADETAIIRARRFQIFQGV